MSDPSSPSSSSTADGALSSGQAQFVYWFNGLFSIVTSVVTPLTLYWKNATPSNSRTSQYNNLVQEVSRQYVSGTIGLLTFFAGGELTRALLEKTVWRNQDPPPTEADKHVGMIVGGAILSFVGYGFIRPMVSMELLHLLKKTEKPDGTATPDFTKLNAPWKQRFSEWLDRFIMKDGIPQPKKMAMLSASSMALYFGLLAASIYGLSTLWEQKSRKAKPSGKPSIVSKESKKPPIPPLQKTEPPREANPATSNPWNSASPPQLSALSAAPANSPVPVILPNYQNNPGYYSGFYSPYPVYTYGKAHTTPYPTAIGVIL